MSPSVYGAIDDVMRPNPLVDAFAVPVNATAFPGAVVVAVAVLVVADVPIPLVVRRGTVFASTLGFSPSTLLVGGTAEPRAPFECMFPQ